MSVHKTFQPNRSSRLADYIQHIYTNVWNVDFFKNSSFEEKRSNSEKSIGF